MWANHNGDGAGPAAMLPHFHAKYAGQWAALHMPDLRYSLRATQRSTRHLKSLAVSVTSGGGTAKLNVMPSKIGETNHV